MFAKSFEIKEKEVKRESSDYTTDIRSNDPIIICSSSTLLIILYTL